MTNTQPFAVRSYENALAFLNKGANAAFFWQLNDEWPETIDKQKAWGFLDLWGNPKPVYEALRTLASRVPIGANVPVAPNQKENTLYTGAFINQNKIIVGIANSKPFACTTTISFVNASKNLKVTDAIEFKLKRQGDPSTGTPDESQVAKKKIKLFDDEYGACCFKVTLSANSTLTVVLEKL